MRRRWIGLAIAVGGLVVTPSLRAQTPGAINFQELFQALDADGDRTITRGEVPESGLAAFDRLLKVADANEDGKIDAEEYRSILERARDEFAVGGGGGAGMARFLAMDKDGDKKVSRAEFSGPVTLFDRLDKDGDGQLTAAEAATGAGLGPGVAAGREFGPRLKPMDKDGDKKITRAEFVGPQALFDRLDGNKDGVIEPAEVRAANQAGAVTKKDLKKAAK